MLDVLYSTLIKFVYGSDESSFLDFFNDFVSVESTGAWETEENKACVEIESWEQDLFRDFEEVVEGDPPFLVLFYP